MSYFWSNYDGPKTKVLTCTIHTQLQKRLFSIFILKFNQKHTDEFCGKISKLAGKSFRPITNSVLHTLSAKFVSVNMLKPSLTGFGGKWGKNHINDSLLSQFTGHVVSFTGIDKKCGRAYKARFFSYQHFVFLRSSLDLAWRPRKTIAQVVWVHPLICYWSI